MSNCSGGDGGVTATVTASLESSSIPTAALSATQTTAGSGSGAFVGASQAPAGDERSSTAARNKQFLEQVVVWPGVNNAGWINLHCHVKNTDPAKNGGKDFVVGWPYKTADELLGMAAWVHGTRKFFDSWFCTSQQSECAVSPKGKNKAKRLASNATWLKAIWIDVDVKAKPADWDAKNPGKPWTHYETVAEAWAAVGVFRAAVGLPMPSAVVHSGSGMHLYWVSTTPLSPQDWRPYAEGLKGLLLREGVKCDAGLTTDPARLLRVPGTLNHKYEPPREVKLIHLGRMYDFATALAVLPNAASGTATAPSHSLVPAGEAEGKAGRWFAELAADKQSEVVRHAARHIARNSKLFELTANGGSYDTYLKVALALARSGVEDAKDIFVEVASTAKGADSEDSLRQFFDGCRSAEPRQDGVTIGTLLHLATESGADFAPWKQVADACDTKIAVYVPGNEGSVVTALMPWWRTIPTPSPWVIRRARW